MHPTTEERLFRLCDAHTRRRLLEALLAVRHARMVALGPLLAVMPYEGRQAGPPR